MSESVCMRTYAGSGVVIEYSIVIILIVNTEDL